MVANGTRDSNAVVFAPEVSDDELVQDNAVEGGTFHIEHSGQLVPPNLPFYYTRINANKILDGLFIGNKEASQDIEFITSIKCTSIVNCAGSSMPNLFSRFGVRYLTFRWLDCRTTHCFDIHGKTLRQIFKFIQPAIEKGEGILVVSPHGNSRACTVVVAYLMIRFKWSLQKALEFVKFRRPETNPKPFYMKQMKRSAKILKLPEQDPERSIQGHWLSSCGRMKELVIRNTFLNGHYIVTPDQHSEDAQQAPQSHIHQRKKLVFADEQNGKKRPLSYIGPPNLLSIPKPWDSTRTAPSVLKGCSKYDPPPTPTPALVESPPAQEAAAGEAGHQKKGDTSMDTTPALESGEDSTTVDKAVETSLASRAQYLGRRGVDPRVASKPAVPAIPVPEQRPSTAPQPTLTYGGRGGRQGLGRLQANRVMASRNLTDRVSQESNNSTIESFSLTSSPNRSPRNGEMSLPKRDRLHATGLARDSLRLRRSINNSTSSLQEELSRPRPKRKYVAAAYNRPVIARRAWMDKDNHSSASSLHGYTRGSPRSRISGMGKQRRSASPRTRISPRPKLNLAVTGYRKNVTSWDSLEAAERHAQRAQLSAPSDTALSKKKAKRKKRSATPQGRMRPRRKSKRVPLHRNPRRQSPRQSPRPRGLGARARSPSPVSRVEHPGNRTLARGRHAAMMGARPSAYDRYRSQSYGNDDIYSSFKQKFSRQRAPSPNSLRPRTLKRASSEESLVTQLSHMKYSQSADRRPSSADGPRFRTGGYTGNRYNARLSNTSPGPISLRRSLGSYRSNR